MKLTDFLNNSRFNSLRNQMRAPLVSWSSQDKGWKNFNPSEWKELIGKGIEVPITEIEFDDDGCFTYKEQKVLVYIRDQYYNDPESLPEYKVHICQCTTLDNMKRKGRYQSRYVVTARHDGTFLVNLIPRGLAWRIKSEKRENVWVEMKVCKNCLKKIHYKGYPVNRQSVYEQFNFKDYLELNETSFGELPRYEPETMPINQYSENQHLLSQLLRENSDYICEECGLDFTEAPHLLHLHHIDGAKNNNTRNNLKIICAECHANSPMHTHMKSLSSYKECIKFRAEKRTHRYL